MFGNKQKKEPNKVEGLRITLDLDLKVSKDDLTKLWLKLWPWVTLALITSFGTVTGIRFYQEKQMLPSDKNHRLEQEFEVPLDRRVTKERGFQSSRLR